MQFDIKYAYFNFLQSIDYRSPRRPMMPEKLCEEMDFGPDDDETRWIIISQSVIFGNVALRSNAEDQNRQGHVSKHNGNNAGKHYLLAANLTCAQCIHNFVLFHLYMTMMMMWYEFTPLPFVSFGGNVVKVRLEATVPKQTFFSVGFF